MAREVIIRIRDDLDGDALADKTVLFTYHGTPYEIDLTAAHADEFDAMMARYTAAGRVVEPEKPKRRRRAGGHARAANTAPHVEQRRRIREWLRETGHAVGDVGKIGEKFIDAYGIANPSDPILSDTWYRPARRRKSAPARVAAEQGNDGELLVDLRGAPAKASAIADKGLRDAIRAWAPANGYTLAARGYIPKPVVDAYRAAH